MGVVGRTQDRQILAKTAKQEREIKKNPVWNKRKGFRDKTSDFGSWPRARAVRVAD